MLGWSLNLFRVRGIQLAVHFSFFLLLAWIAKDGWDERGWEGLFWNSATLIAFFTCVVLHEFGHSFTALHFGIGVRRILLMPIGGMAEFDSIPRQPSRELLITLAGPAVNFVIAGVLWLYLWQIDHPIYVHTLNGFLYELCIWNLVMGVFNLLPAFPMDGGRILRAALAIRQPYLRATYLAATIGKLVCLVGMGLAAWFGTWLVAVLFGFIFFAGEAEYRAVRRREIEDAQWREMLARYYARSAEDESASLPR
jgi:Zn-dependent proteases